MPGESDLRGEILLAARRLFIEHGYRGLAMRQIAQAVGVSKAALYYHFQDKEQLFLAVLLAYLNDVEAMVDHAQSTGENARQQVTLLVGEILSQPDEQRALIRLASQELVHIQPAARAVLEHAYREKFTGKIEAILSAGIASGELRPLNPVVAAWALLGMIFPYTYPHRLQESSARQLVEQMTSIFLDGMAAGFS